MTREWYFQAMGQELGPLSVSELKAKVSNGQIQPDTLVRKGPEGRWVFGGNVKGLFAAPEEPPPPPAPIPSPVAAKPKSSTALPVTSPPKPGSNTDMATKTVANPSSSTIAASHFMTLHEEESESRPLSLEFYDFVGFREAISPVLHDAMRKFVSDRGITMCQLNRRAIADFIQRPDLASDLLITAIAAVPQPVNEKSNRDGSNSLADNERDEFATFRFTLFNSSRSAVQVGEAVFLPASVEERTYDTIAKAPHPGLDQTGHIRVKLGSVVPGKAIRMSLNFEIPPQATQDIIIWFYNDPKPNFLKVRGQLLVGHGGELAMSEYFTITLHGDSPIPK